MAGGALAGVRVLDLTRYIAGPYCTRLLAGSGAEIIKIEKPGGGDPARSIGPFLHDEPGLEKSGLFLYLNGGKKSITLDVATSTGARLLRELAATADIVIEDFAPGRMAEMGIGLEALHAVNPRLVMASITPFGQTGPYRDYHMDHITAWGMSGFRYVDGAPGVQPVQIGGWLTHYVTGLFACTGTLTALYERNETGAGRHVDVSMWESNILVTCYPTVAYSYNGIVHNGISKERFGLLPCKDGYIGLNLYGRLNWEMLTAFLGVPELAADPRFSTPAALFQNYEEARAIVADKVKDREKMELFQAGVEWRIPFGLVPTADEILASPQHQARGFFETVEHAVVGKVTMPGAPFRLEETPWQTPAPAPLLGEHNREVYCGRLGYGAEDLVRLKGLGVV